MIYDLVDAAIYMMPVCATLVLVISLVRLHLRASG